MNKRYFCCFFVAVVLGICVSVLTSFSKIVILVFALLSLTVFKKRLLFVFSLVTLLSITVTAFSYKEHTEAYQDITVSGTVSQVHELNDALSLVIKNCSYGELKDTGVYVHIYDYKYDFLIKEGNVIEITGNAYPVKYNHTNPGEAPFSQLYKNIGYNFYVEDFSVIDTRVNVEYLFSTLKDEIRKSVFSSIDNSDASAVLYAMITGDKSYISQEVAYVFSSCGTSHLLAVSGLHIGILLHLFTYLLEKLKIKNILAVVLLGVFVTVYSAFTGFSSSVLRASIMAMVHALSKLWGGKYDSLNSLSFAGSVILLSEPFRMFDVAFQLSFCACFGIAWITKYTLKTKNKLFNAVFNAGAITFGATAFTLPLQIYYFGTVSFISLIANMLFVSVSSFALMLAFILVIPALLWYKLDFLLKLPGYIMIKIVELSRSLAEFPHISFKPASLLLVLVILVLMVFFTRFVHIGKRIKVKTLGGILLITVLSFIGITTFKSNNISFNVPYFDEKTLTVHIDSDKYYIVGLCSEKDSLERQIKYTYRNTNRVEAVFIMTENHMSALPQAIENGLEFKALYVSPEITMNKTARMHRAQYLEEAVYIDNGRFEYDGNLIFTYGGKEILLYNGKDTYKKYDIAVTDSLITRARTIITKGVETDNATKLYDVDKLGHTRIYIRSKQ